MRSEIQQKRSGRLRLHLANFVDIKYITKRMFQFPENQFFKSLVTASYVYWIFQKNDLRDCVAYLIYSFLEMHKYKKRMKGRNLFTFVNSAPEIVFIAITWLCQGMFINAHKCFQSRSNSINFHHVKIIQEQSNIHYSLFSVFYYSKGLDHLYYMKHTLVVSQSVTALASHL